MSKFKCPAAKRKVVYYNSTEFLGYHVVIADDYIHHSRYDYAGPHAYWDFLHESATFDWRPSNTIEFRYMKPGRPWSVTAVLFASKVDAMKFVLQFGGVYYSDLAAEHHEEELTYRIIRDIAGLSRADRQRSYPGLDELVLASAPKPDA